MPSITSQKLLLIALVVGFSVTVMGKGPFRGFPGGPSPATASTADARQGLRYIWTPPMPKTDADTRVVGEGHQRAAGHTTRHAWDLDVDY